MSEVGIREINYKDFGRCVQISNGIVDIVVTADMGPRVIRYGFAGGDNEFCEYNGATKKVWDDTWNIRGGHRLWHSPEGDPRSYVPDNGPVEWVRIENGISVSQKVEPWVQIKKDMSITLSPNSSIAKVVHKLTNKNAWPVELSAWALSVMATGGVQVVPQPSRETGLLANRIIALWPYSKMDDPRIHWGDKYIVFRQDAKMQPPFKFGIPNEDGWAAYFNHGNMFIKKFTHQMGAKYPDFGVSYETYTTDYMMEMETLSPLATLNTDESVCHVEEWELIKNVSASINDEDAIDRIVQKYIMER